MSTMHVLQGGGQIELVENQATINTLRLPANSQLPGGTWAAHVDLSGTQTPRLGGLAYNSFGVPVIFKRSRDELVSECGSLLRSHFSGSKGIESAATLLKESVPDYRQSVNR